MISKYLLNLIRVTDRGNPVYKVTYGHMEDGEFIAAWWIYLSDTFAREIAGREIDTSLTFPYKPFQEDWQVGFYAEVEGFDVILGNQHIDLENQNENLSSLGAGCFRLSMYI